MFDFAGEEEEVADDGKGVEPGAQEAHILEGETSGQQESGTEDSSKEGISLT